MKTRVLIVASVAAFVRSFLMNQISMLRDEFDCDIEVAANFQYGSPSPTDTIQTFGQHLERIGITTHQVDFARSPLQLGPNLKAFQQLATIAKTRAIDVLHAHTPVAGVAARMVGLRCNLPVIYTAHGFHFYTGAPLRNWILYYPIERLLAHWTTALITINLEDAERAGHFRNTHTYYVPGMGVELPSIPVTQEAREALRTQLGITSQELLCLSVGELNTNKNHSLILRAMTDPRLAQLHYAVAGQGPLDDQLQRSAEELGINHRFHLLGHRSDVSRLLAASDIFALPSIREGLNVSLMEAMAAGLPVVCAQIRGNTDLVHSGVNGFFFQPNDPESTANAIHHLLQSDLQAMGTQSLAIVEPFTWPAVHRSMHAIFADVLGAPNRPRTTH